MLATQAFSETSLPSLFPGTQANSEGSSVWASLFELRKEFRKPVYTECAESAGRRSPVVCTGDKDKDGADKDKNTAVVSDSEVEIVEKQQEPAKEPPEAVPRDDIDDSDLDDSGSSVVSVKIVTRPRKTSYTRKMSPKAFNSRKRKTNFAQRARLAIQPTTAHDPHVGLIKQVGPGFQLIVERSLIKTMQPQELKAELCKAVDLLFPNNNA